MSISLEAVPTNSKVPKSISQETCISFEAVPTNTKMRSYFKGNFLLMFRLTDLVHFWMASKCYILGCFGTGSRNMLTQMLMEFEIFVFVVFGTGSRNMLTQRLMEFEIFVFVDCLEKCAHFSFLEGSETSAFLVFVWYCLERYAHVRFLESSEAFVCFGFFGTASRNMLMYWPMELEILISRDCPQSDSSHLV